jgi:heme-degrading monooxygenase HmoA
MIARTWHGWAASPADADAYESHFRSAVLPELEQLTGFREARLLRREEDGEVEFIALTFFDSIEAVRSFAGEDYEQAVVAPEARRVLSRFDQRSVHYEVVVHPGSAS